MDSKEIKALITAEFTDKLKFDLSDEMKKEIDLWLEVQLEKLFKETSAIPKEEVRLKSVGMMLGKKFDRLVKLIDILDRRELADDTVLFGELLGLLM